MKKNSIQINYIAARVAWQMAKKEQEEKYGEFLKIKGISEDDTNFDAFKGEYEEFAKAEIANSAIAWKGYKEAEKALLDFGIAIAPANIREQLSKIISGYYKHKVKMIEDLLRLDVSTIPASVLAA